MLRNEKSKGMLGTIQGNIVDAQKSDQDKKAEAEAFEKRKEEAKEAAAEKVKNGDNAGGSGGLMGSMFGGTSNFTTGACSPDAIVS